MQLRKLTGTLWKKNHAWVKPDLNESLLDQTGPFPLEAFEEIWINSIAEYLSMNEALRLRAVGNLFNNDYICGEFGPLLFFLSRNSSDPSNENLPDMKLCTVKAHPSAENKPEIQVCSCVERSLSTSLEASRNSSDPSNENLTDMKRCTVKAPPSVENKPEIQVCSCVERSLSTSLEAC